MIITLMELSHPRIIDVRMIYQLLVEFFFFSFLPSHYLDPRGDVVVYVRRVEKEHGPHTKVRNRHGGRCSEAEVRPVRLTSYQSDALEAGDQSGQLCGL